MHQLPHNYTVNANTKNNNEITITGKGLPALLSAPPIEFDGPGDKWSPENLLTSAIAGCFMLTFNAMATASKMYGLSLQCKVSGTMDMREKQMQFIGFNIDAILTIPANMKEDRCLRLLERAKQTCLITNSVKAACHLDAKIEIQS